jgi:glycosyltransferase involved in cell wall biosynthesis
MPTSPKVSICIPSYNHARFLPAAIESALGQSYRNFEILIGDDGSSDNSLEIAKAYAARHPAVIKVLTHSEDRHLGIGKTSNLLLRSARGDFWSGLPSDDVLFPDKLEHQVKFLENHDQFGWVYSYARIIDETGQARPERPLFGKDITRAPNPLHRLIEGNVIPAMTVLARRKCLEQVGGENESLIYSDWDYWVRLLAASNVAFIERPLAGFRFHGRNTSEGVDPLENLERGRAVMSSLRALAATVCNELAASRTRALLDLQLAFHYYYLGNYVDAEQSLGFAFNLDVTLAKDSKFFSRWLRDRVLESIYRFPNMLEHHSFPSWLLHRLSSFSAKRLSRCVSAAASAQTAIAKVGSDRRQARAAALRCLSHDPGWINDRALRSVLVESVVGGSVMAGLRRQVHFGRQIINRPKESLSKHRVMK